MVSIFLTKSQVPFFIQIKGSLAIAVIDGTDVAQIVNLRCDNDKIWR
jgi:hypothetical protein